MMHFLFKESQFFSSVHWKELEKTANVIAASALEPDYDLWVPFSSSPPSIKRYLGSLRKMIGGLGQEMYKASLKCFFLPENKKAVKDSRPHVQKIRNQLKETPTGQEWDN